MSNQLTIDQFHRVLPKGVKTTVTQETIDNINTMIKEPEMAEIYRDNLLSYTNVMKDGKFKIEQYLDAVRYVSYKLLGSTNIEAYTKTFPDRYQRFIQNNVTPKDISSYVAAYNKNKLVNLIMEQSLIPSHILNADLYQKALNVQADLMINANSEKVRTDAANSILNQLKAPETKKVELDIAVKEDSAIAELRQSTLDLAAQQRKMIETGVMSAKDIAHTEIIVGECEVVDKD